MAQEKAATTKDNTESPIQALKEGTCPTSSGKSNLGYQVGADKSGGIHLKVSSNDGGGMFSPEWVSFTNIQAALKEWPEDQGVTSMTFRKIFRGKSANTPGFLVAVLCAEGIIEPMGEKKRVHQSCDPAAFLASVKALIKGATPKAKPKTKAAPKEKPKTPRKATDKTAKTPRKTTGKNPKNP
jgi:hypothetical protein